MFASIAILMPLLTAQARAAEEMTRYILDTDIASDCDDAGAVAMVNAAIDNGDLNVLAMTVSTGGPYGAPALAAINAWYGHREIPVGTLKDPKFWVGGGKDKPAGAFNFESFNHVLTEQSYAKLKSGEDAPDAVDLLRKTLAAQPDSSVVIQTIGPLPNAYNLMRSKPDAHSPLDGMALVKQKVKMLIITGGRQPAGTSSNFSKAGAAKFTKPVIDLWPTRIVFVGNDVGHDIKSSWKRNADKTKESPARRAYALFYKDDGLHEHHSADQAGILFAIKGIGDVYELVENGHQTCDDSGNTKWVEGKVEGKDHAYVKRREGAKEKIADQIEAMMTQPRKDGRL